jgi:hypothetical protein
MPRLSSLLVLCILALGLTFSTTATTHACTLINDGNQPDGWGAAYNVYSRAGELIVRADCTIESFTPEIGSSLTDSENFAVYGTGYYYDGETWTEMSYTPTADADTFGPWILGDAVASTPIDYVPGTNTFFAAYTCHWRGSDEGWQCGCQDAACDTPAWQLQAVPDPIPPTTSGEGGDIGQDSDENRSIDIDGEYRFPLPQLQDPLIMEVPPPQLPANSVCAEVRP